MGIGSGNQIQASDEVKSGATSTGNTFYRISGIQGALSAPPFPFATTHRSQGGDLRSQPISETEVQTSGLNQPMLWLLAAAAVVAYLHYRG